MAVVAHFVLGREKKAGNPAKAAKHAKEIRTEDVYKRQRLFRTTI